MQRERSKGIPLTYQRMLRFAKKHSRRPVDGKKYKPDRPILTFRVYPEHMKIVQTLRDNNINTNALMKTALELVTGLPTTALLIKYDEFARVIYMTDDSNRVNTVTIGNFDATVLRVFQQQGIKAEQYGIKAVKDWAVANGYEVIGCNVTNDEYSETYLKTEEQ